MSQTPRETNPTDSPAGATEDSLPVGVVFGGVAGGMVLGILLVVLVVVIACLVYIMTSIKRGASNLQDWNTEGEPMNTERTNEVRTSRYSFTSSLSLGAHATCCCVPCCVYVMSTNHEYMGYLSSFEDGFY